MLRDYESVRLGEQSLRDGIVELAHGLVECHGWAFFYLAADWFARIVRHEILARFEIARPESEGVVDAVWGLQPVRGILSSRNQAARFYEVPGVFACDVFRRGGREGVRVWVDEDSESGDWFRRNPQSPEVLGSWLTPDLMYKYMIPQMLVQHFWLKPSTSVAWDFVASDWMIGAA